MQRPAAKALANLAGGKAEIQAAIAGAGGIAPLVRLAEGGAAVHYLARYLIVVKGSEVTYGLCFFNETGRECQQPRWHHPCMRAGER